MTVARLTLREDQATAVLWADAVRAPNVAPLIVPYQVLPDNKGKPERRPLVAGYHGSLTRPQADSRTEQPLGLWTEWARAGVWGRVRPDAWAIPPGRLGVVVIDVDNPALLPELLELYGETSVWVLSPSGGTHLYYRAPAGPAPPSRTGVRRSHSYDVKSDGATIHAPGSRHHTYPGRYTADAPGIVDGALRRGCTPVLKSSELWHAMPVFRAAVADLEWETWHPTKEQPLDLEEIILEDTPALRDFLLDYMVNAAGPAISGNGGHDHTRWLINRIGDFGATLELTVEMFAEWNDLCACGWSARELEAKVRYYYPRRLYPIGCRARETGLVVDDESGAPDEGDAADDGELASKADENGMCARMVAGWSSQ